MLSNALRTACRLCLLITALWLALPVRAGESPTFRKVRDTGILTLGYRVASPPFSYLDARRKPIGYTMDICNRVVDAVREQLGLPGLEVKLIAVTSATRLPLVANGAVDMECGITTNTAERQKSAAFSITTFVAESRILSKKALPMQTLDDLRGRLVATTLATTSILYLSGVNQARSLDMKIMAGFDDNEAFAMLQSDRAVAFVMDDVLLRSLLTTAPDAADYVISDLPLTVEPYGIVLPRGDAAFKQLVDGVIMKLFRSGEIYAIYKRWFQWPIPPKGSNLQLPMSASLERVIQHPTDASDPAVYLH
jgi:glutamate/aspartate transport system substrate-binding protein